MSARSEGGRAAVFLDKDGTLVEDVPYNVDPERIRLAPGALEGLARLQELGHALVVVSNQSGVARGLFAEAALEGVWARLRALLAEGGVALDAVRYCPHHPDGTVAPHARACGCRKPAPGMIEDAAAALGLDLARSWMIGDILDDVEAGRRAGVRTVLIDNGNETEWALSPARLPHHLAPDLAAAARIVEAVDAGGRDGAAPGRARDARAGGAAAGTMGATAEAGAGGAEARARALVGSDAAEVRAGRAEVGSVCAQAEPGDKAAPAEARATAAAARPAVSTERAPLADAPAPAGAVAAPGALAKAAAKERAPAP